MVERCAHSTSSSDDDRFREKCLQEGHKLAECPNDWVCRACKTPGHKEADCVTFDEEDESLAHSDLSTCDNESSDDEEQNEVTASKADDHTADSTHSTSNEVPKKNPLCQRKLLTATKNRIKPKP
ncbi:hypothetical protein FSP39_002244 [Pinctada imbricata]|uniref:CCHC-type domain-containing protein n=1 Tax=Pinctada imbricata TaxID=66713 RepID=A0AA88XXY2_PINIB|nr:hypothetical protein FSP39_002244 [Pinctada imbricata]